MGSWLPGAPQQGRAGLCSESGVQFTGGQVGTEATGWKLPTQASSSGGLQCPLVLQPLPCFSRGLSSLLCKMGHKQPLLLAMP